MSTITVNKSEFLLGLKTGGVFAGRSASLPILSCVKISVRGNRMYIVSSDAENAIRHAIGVLASDADTAFCVSFSEFVSYVRLVKDDTITLKTTDTTISVEHSGGSVVFPLEPAEDFPVMPSSAEDSRSVSVPAATLAAFVHEALPFVSGDTIRPVLNSVYFYLSGKSFGYCATDSMKLCTTEMHVSQENDFDFMLGRNAAKAVIDMAADGELVTISKNSNNISFSCGATVVKSVQTEAKFPNFRAIIPASSPMSASVVSRAFQEALGRCRVVAGKDSFVKLRFAPGSVTIELDQTQTGKRAVETIPAECDFEFAIAFNTAVLGDCTAAVTSEKFSLLMGDERRAAVIMDGEDKNKKILAMPVRLT